jgi:hypothetical protein
MIQTCTNVLLQMDLEIVVHKLSRTILGLKGKVLTVHDIPEDPTIRTSKTPSVETRRSVDTTMFSSLSGDFLKGLSQNSETENLSEIFNNAPKSLFRSQDDSTKLISGKSDASLLISPTEKPLKPKRKKDASDSDASSMVSSGTRAATKRLRQSQADVNTSAPEPKQMKPNRGKEAKAARQRKFVESLNEMNRKNYADVGRYYKGQFSVNLQQRLLGKTYYKDTDSTSSSTKSKQKSEFDFLDPSKAFSLDMQKQIQSNEEIDTVNSVAMSLSNDQDSMHTALSTHDIVQSTFGNEAYEGDEEWHEELLPLPTDREESIHMYIPSSKEQRQVLVDEAIRRKVFVYKNLPNPPDYIYGVTYSIAKDYISQKLHSFIKNPAWINRVQTFYSLPALFIEEKIAKAQVQFELQSNGITFTQHHVHHIMSDGNCLFNAIALAKYGRQSFQGSVRARLSEFLKSEAMFYRLYEPADNSPDSQSYLFKNIKVALMYDITLQGVVNTVLPNYYIDPYVYDSLYRLVCNTYADSLQDQLHLVALYDAYIQTDKTWGGDADMYILSVLLNVTICVWGISLYLQEAGARTKKDPNPKPKYVFGGYILNKVYRPNAPFVQPNLHTTIHLLSTKFKGPKFDSETGVIHSCDHFEIFINTQASQMNRFSFTGPSISSWELPSNLHNLRFDDTRMNEIYDEWSKEIYTCRIDYSHYNSQYAQMNQGERDVHELSLGSKLHLCPSTPPRTIIPNSIDTASATQVSPLRTHIASTTYGEALAAQDIQRYTSVERELGERSPEKISQDLGNNVQKYIQDRTWKRNGTIKLKIKNPKTNVFVDCELDVEFNKFDIPYMQGETKSFGSINVFKALEEYQCQLALSIDKRQQESRLLRQQRLQQTKLSSCSTSRSTSPAVQRILGTISERTETTSTEESQHKSAHV